MGARGTDLKASKKKAHGTDDSTIKSFHSPPVAHAIMASIQPPKVKLINWYVVIFVLLEADDISMPVTHVTVSLVVPVGVLICTRVGTLIVATIYLQLIQNRYMFRSFTVHCSQQHCVQPVASDVEVVGYL